MHFDFPYFPILLPEVEEEGIVLVVPLLGFTDTVAATEKAKTSVSVSSY